MAPLSLFHWRLTKAANLAVELPLYLYASIVDSPEAFGSSSEDSVDIILSRIREACIEDTISLAIGGQRVTPLESLRIRRDARRASRKPVVTIAAKEGSPQRKAA